MLKDACIAPLILRGLSNNAANQLMHRELGKNFSKSEKKEQELKKRLEKEQEECSRLQEIEREYQLIKDYLKSQDKFQRSEQEEEWVNTSMNFWLEPGRLDTPWWLELNFGISAILLLSVITSSLLLMLFNVLYGTLNFLLSTSFVAIPYLLLRLYFSKTNQLARLKAGLHSHFKKAHSTRSGGIVAEINSNEFLTSIDVKKINAKNLKSQSKFNKFKVITPEAAKLLPTNNGDLFLDGLEFLTLKVAQIFKEFPIALSLKNLGDNVDEETLEVLRSSNNIYPYVEPTTDELGPDFYVPPGGW